MLYSTLLFDGVTTFLPELDSALDQQVEHLYHASMIQEGKSGYKAGRTLLALLMNSDLTILETGSSDWAIVPSHGTYESDEEALLAAILDFHQEVLQRWISVTDERDHTPEAEHTAAAVQNWLKTRRNQFYEGRLALLTHQWDVLVRK